MIKLVYDRHSVLMILYIHNGNGDKGYSDTDILVYCTYPQLLSRCLVLNMCDLLPMYLRCLKPHLMLCISCVPTNR